ncbi:Crp/Fnr family transcriptional regulator [Myxococcota bacterium]|nr:Crp/Fnr family transcriptional regulator [Myxococcota bacterium]
MAIVGNERKREILAGVGLFGGLSDQDLEGIAAVTTTRKLSSREELFHKGDQGSQVYVVCTGRLKILTTSMDGDNVVFNTVGPGEVIGEMALITGAPRNATVTAVEPCELLVIDRRDFLAFVRSHPDTAIQLLVILANRLRGVSELVEDTLFLNLPPRLAKKLTSYAERYGESTPQGIRIDLKLSQEEWGDLVGTTRESINKQMRTWASDGLISVERGYVIIHRMEEMERIANQILV